MIVKVNIPETEKLKTLLKRHQELIAELDKNLEEIERESFSMQIDIEKATLEI